MMDERKGIEGNKAYPHRIDMNTLPHIDVVPLIMDTPRRNEMVNETRKILW